MNNENLNNICVIAADWWGNILRNPVYIGGDTCKELIDSLNYAKTFESKISDYQITVFKAAFFSSLYEVLKTKTSCNIIVARKPMSDILTSSLEVAGINEEYPFTWGAVMTVTRDMIGVKENSSDDMKTIYSTFEEVKR